MKKTFKIVTMVTSVKELEYVIEANSEEEALKLFNEDETYFRNGNEVDDEIDWTSEQIESIDLIEN